MKCPQCGQYLTSVDGHVTCSACGYTEGSDGRPAPNRRHKWMLAIIVVLLVLAVVLGGVAIGYHGTNNKAPVATSPTAKPTTQSTPTPTPGITNTWSANSVNPKALPLGDGKVSATTAAVGIEYTCQQSDPNGGGAQVNGPWIHGTTWDSTAKTAVSGQVSWPTAKSSITTSATTRVITTNDLPEGQYTGIFPIARTDPAYAYDKNPNSIVAQNLTVTLPLNPTALAKPACTAGGPIGIMSTGVYLYNPLDALNRDAVAHETQDKCDGHPSPHEDYHYHDVPSCIRDAATGASTVVGYAYDGYPIVVERNAAGALPTNADLDVCHGRTSPILENGQIVTTYHYDSTLEFPYVIGCFHAKDAVPSAH